VFVDGCSVVVVDFCIGLGVIVIVVVYEVLYVEVYVVELDVHVLVWVWCNVVFFVLCIDLCGGDVVMVFVDFDGVVDVVVSNLLYVLLDVVFVDFEVCDYDF